MSYSDRKPSSGAASLLILLSGCGSSVEREPPTPLQPLRDALTVVTEWRVDGGETGDAGVSKLRPYIDKAIVYTVDVSGVLVARRLDDGARRWERNLQRRISAGVGGDAERLDRSRRRGIENKMGVGAAEAKGADAGTQGMVGLRPSGGFRRHLYR